MPYKLVMLLPSPILITDGPEQVEVGNWYYKGENSIEVIMQDTPNYKLPKILAGINGLPILVNNLSLEDSYKIKWLDPHAILKNTSTSFDYFDERYSAYEKGFTDGVKAVMNFYKTCFTLKDINGAFDESKDYIKDDSLLKNTLQSILKVKIYRVDVNWECTHCGGHNAHKMSCKSLTRKERIVLINNEIAINKLL